MATVDVPARLLEPRWWALLWVLTVGGVLAVAMAIDKRAARHGRRRIRERTLLGLAVVGGAPLGLLAMQALGHKTRHMRFRVVFSGFAVLWIVIALALVVRA